MTERLIVFDTTLRDGEQCPGASLNEREKVERLIFSFHQEFRTRGPSRSAT